MAEYFIMTSSGTRGPFSAAVIQRGVAEGKIPPNAHLKESGTDATVRAGDVRADSLAEPMHDSSPDMPGVTPAQQQPAQPQPPQYAQPQPAYPRQAQPQQAYAQPAYPQQQPAAGQYGRSPYPGTQYPAYPQGQYGAYPQAYPQIAPAYQQPYGQPQRNYGMPYPQSRQASGLAIASLVLSLVTVASCLPTFIGGIICGFLALKECEPYGPKQGRGLALGGLWSGIGLGVLYVLFIFLIIAAETMK